MASMYSIFLPFYHNLWDLTDYNIAYYGANASLERGLLASKYHQPGFEWSGWRENHNNFWPASDAEIPNFSRFNYDQNGLSRQIISQTTQIPNTWQGNIPHLLSATWSQDYNILDYQDTESFVMSIDHTNNPNEYYQTPNTNNIIAFTGTQVQATLRLPPKVYEKFWWNSNALLCDIEQANCDINQDGIFNEAIVARWINGIYEPSSINMPFQIIPTTSIFFNTTPPMIDLLHDNNLREDTINYSSYTANNPETLDFSNNFNPIIHNISYLITQHNVLAQSGAMIKDNPFSTIFHNSHSVISLNINHPLQSRNQQIYPFLEYKAQFDQNIADRFYHIYGTAKVWNYKVTLLVNKPSLKQSTVGDFTIIF